MNDQILVEIRDSLNEIKALASPVVVMEADYSFTPEQEQDLQDSLSKVRGGLFVTPQPAEALALKQKLFNGLNINREVVDIVSAINALAIANTDVLHIMTNFSGHVNSVEVYAYPSASTYGDGSAIKLMRSLVYLDDGDALQKLLEIESQLTELIIAAREEAEAKAEVEA
ncbi:hypothetical protein [Vibrio parahaemolyticus]|uniref:hypothetical protein n=1 Tax=Vibrio parahaemolyticus TaxID=670 RepID=UPI0011231BE5|nr:hypothetical protein [Vibrio parahaemolyticus]TOC23688.1 hypothetical protein CGJ89_20935 [Vibrio parahaemolyticus]